MATWNDVLDALSARFTLDRTDPEEIALTLERKDAAGQVRAQRVMVRHYAAWGEPILELRSAFAEVGTLDTAQLLVESLRLPIGAVALHGQYLVLVQKVPLAYTTIDGVLFLLTRVTHLADVLEQRQGGDRF